MFILVWKHMYTWHIETFLGKAPPVDTHQLTLSAYVHGQFGLGELEKYIKEVLVKLGMSPETLFQDNVNKMQDICLCNK